MESDQKKSKIKSEKIERVPLTKKSVKIVFESLDKLSAKYPAISINKRDLVNWIIEEQFKRLNSKIETLLFNKFYDEEMILREALSKVKKLKRDGGDINLSELVPLKKIQSKPKSKKPTASKGTIQIENRENL